MSIVITTTYKTNASGKGQIVAKGGGKQRTAPYAHDLSVRDNHRHAMLTLATALGLDTFPRSEVVEVDNGKARFTLT